MKPSPKKFQFMMLGKSTRHSDGYREVRMGSTPPPAPPPLPPKYLAAKPFCNFYQALAGCHLF